MQYVASQLVQVQLLTISQNGDITDPPASTVSASIQFANPQPFEVESIFCRTCVKNQEIVARLLANYLPDEDAPGYRAALNGLPAYEERLHRDYPQCCARCEPQARYQLTAATKAAAADNMRLQMQRSKLRRTDSLVDFRSLLLQSARIGYFVSILMQLLWHFFNTQPSSTTPCRGPAHCFAEWPAPIECRQTIAAWVPHATIAGLFFIWWNPGWSRKLHVREGRLIGLGQFYTVQVMIMIIRVGGWPILRGLIATDQKNMIIHSVLLVVLTMLTVYGLSVIRLDTTPLVDWTYEPPSLVSEAQYIPPTSPEVPTFPVTHLGSTQAQDKQAWRPPTPPVEDEDAMDWTPSQNFQPVRRQEKVAAPSPFFGRLPTLPGGMRRQEPKQAIGLPPGFFDNRATLPMQRRPSIPKPMAEPSFFPSSVDTGLENLFGQVFSLGDGSSTSARRTSTQSGPRSQAFPVPENVQQATLHEPAPSSNVATIFLVISALILLGIWVVSERLFGVVTASSVIRI